MRIEYFKVKVRRPDHIARSYSREFPTLADAKDYANKRVAALVAGRDGGSVELSCKLAGALRGEALTPIKNVYVGRVPNEKRCHIASVREFPRPACTP